MCSTTRNYIWTWFRGYLIQSAVIQCRSTKPILYGLESIISLELKIRAFPGPGYLRFEDGVVWLWHSLVNLYIWLTISSCYSSILLTLGLIERDGGLSTLCHSSGFACQQTVPKTFPGPGYLRSEDGVVWLWHYNIGIYISIYICIEIYIPIL